MSVRALLITSALLAAASAVDRSTCGALWFFKLPCAQTAGALGSRVKAWSTQEGHGSREQCMYEITKESPTALEFRRTCLHTTTEMAFHFTPPSGLVFCKIRARSTTTSQNADRPDDYCLLHSVINGSGLTRAEGYKEICNEAMCPSKESAPCNDEESVHDMLSVTL